MQMTLLFSLKLFVYVAIVAIRYRRGFFIFKQHNTSFKTRLFQVTIEKWI